MKLTFIQYAASIILPILGAVYFICEWNAAFGHRPYGYEPSINWPFSCVFAIACILIAICAIINAMHQEMGPID